MIFKEKPKISEDVAHFEFEFLHVVESFINFMKNLLISIYETIMLKA